MLNLSYSDLKNLSWVNWLDPLRQVNSNFDQKVFEELRFDKIKLNITRDKIIKNLSNESIELFNKKEIIHRLSHQELYIKFWILHTSDNLKHGIVWSEVSKRAVPIVIDRFIREFQS